jgi:hypothetical protein
MTIDKLIAYICDCSGSHSEQLPTHVGEQVIAVLKAGQIVYEALLDLADEHGLVYEEAIQAWDAATKEDV